MSAEHPEPLRRVSELAVEAASPSCLKRLELA
jgi:hypothetical protein